jgi:aldose 1-epimerase
MTQVEETAVNITNHSYFNLSGGPTIEDTEVSLCSNLFLPVDDGGIPTAGPTKYAGVTPKNSFTLGPVEPDIDDCFVVDVASPQDKSLDESVATCHLDTRKDPIVTLVSAYHPATKIHLEVQSTE